MGKIALCNINFIDIETALAYVNQTIEIDNGYIVSIYDTSDHKPSSLFKCYNYNDLWAMPGLIDMHVHITMSPSLSEPPHYVNPKQIIEVSYSNLQELQSIGVTLCRDMGSYSYSAEWVKSIFRKSALPEILTCGEVFTYSKGHMCEYGSEISDKETITTSIERNSNRGADFLKIASDPRDTEAIDRVPNPAFDVDIIHSIVYQARENHMEVACHTYPSVDGVMRALKGGVRTIEHAVPLIEAMEMQYYPNTYYVPTFSTALDVCGIDRLDCLDVAKNKTLLNCIHNQIPSKYPYVGEIPASIEEWYQILINSLPKAIAKNQLLCTGSDAGCKGTDFKTLLREILLMCVLGATNQQALLYATNNPCKALRLNKRGSIKIGNIADMIILRKNPLIDIETLISNVAVVKKGVLVEK